ncbi:MAG: MoxR family ATPase [Spirochaetes bacterium]|nr:MoxR family ATPase [Spirochaetota bacterium]
MISSSLEANELQQLIQHMQQVIVGKRRVLELLVTALLAEGHVLLEDVPGIGKTLIGKTLAHCIYGTFKRIQFTPDLLPSDITGFSVFDSRTGAFSFHPGPVMANVLLADEINRTVPRTQSSLLESMGEFQVTVDNVTYPLPRPFFVIATQNPIEMDGTFPLPEAQLDRFLMRIDLGYPTPLEETLILERFQTNEPLRSLSPVTTPERIVELQQKRSHVYVSPSIREYLSLLVQATRLHPSIRYGASPRATLNLLKAAQAWALLQGRSYVLPDDIQELSGPVLLHRLILKPEERLRGITPKIVLDEVLRSVPVPLPQHEYPNE